MLPHLQIKISNESEILVKGPVFNGYLNKQGIDKDIYMATGDIGFIDDDLYLYISGRKKNQFITSFGRNVSPEWVEDKLTENSIINKAFVYGEAKPWNAAILFSSLDANSIRDRSIAQIVKQMNETLPDYAQIKKWIIAGDVNSKQYQHPTQSGLQCRKQIFNTYKKQIDSLYESEICS